MSGASELYISGYTIHLGLQAHLDNMPFSVHEVYINICLSIWYTWLRGMLTIHSLHIIIANPFNHFCTVEFNIYIFSPNYLPLSKYVSYPSTHESNRTSYFLLPSTHSSLHEYVPGGFRATYPISLDYILRCTRKLVAIGVCVRERKAVSGHAIGCIGIT